MERKNYVKKEYCCPELSVIPVSAEPIMGTNSPLSLITKRQKMTTVTRLMLNQINSK